MADRVRLAKEFCSDCSHSLGDIAAALEAGDGDRARTTREEALRRAEAVGHKKCARILRDEVYSCSRPSEEEQRWKHEMCEICNREMNAACQALADNDLETASDIMDGALRVAEEENHQFCLVLLREVDRDVDIAWLHGGVPGLHSDDSESEDDDDDDDNFGDGSSDDSGLDIPNGHVLDADDN